MNKYPKDEQKSVFVKETVLKSNNTVMMRVFQAKFPQKE